MVKLFLLPENLRLLSGLGTEDGSHTNFETIRCVISASPSAGSRSGILRNRMTENLEVPKRTKSLCQINFGGHLPRIRLFIEERDHFEAPIIRARAPKLYTRVLVLTTEVKVPEMDSCFVLHWVLFSRSCILQCTPLCELQMSWSWNQKRLSSQNLIRSNLSSLMELWSLDYPARRWDGLDLIVSPVFWIQNRKGSDVSKPNGAHSAGIKHSCISFWHGNSGRQIWKTGRVPPWISYFRLEMKVHKRASREIKILFGTTAMEWFHDWKT